MRAGSSGRRAHPPRRPPPTRLATTASARTRVRAYLVLRIILDRFCQGRARCSWQHHLLRYAPDAEHAKAAAMDPSHRRHRPIARRSIRAIAKPRAGRRAAQGAGLGLPLATTGPPSVGFRPDAVARARHLRVTKRCRAAHTQPLASCRAPPRSERAPFGAHGGRTATTSSLCRYLLCASGDWLRDWTASRARPLRSPSGGRFSSPLMSHFILACWPELRLELFLQHLSQR